ncbi:DUF2147 domain-containing protein [Marivivens donghaensis]|uniref:DUF2147 domain-containing protein n=1 Tax=Marivivens donghaensis TaxID=1699413 RepID=A0ABX0VZ00_9RHOB|nr:DUF2147 domain-containing protein [Marivivens donghaensis]NIY72466.1 DUF2147 domain-containing protein [Marivivens donghaensis]
MKKFALAALMAVGLAGAAAADPIEGTWQTQPDDGAFAFVEISPCGPAFCGVIARTFNADGEYQSENIGRQLVIDMVPQGEGEYRGNVWRPSNNKIYIGKINLNGDQMELKGCIAGGLLCSAQNWVRR